MAFGNAFLAAPEPYKRRLYLAQCPVEALPRLAEDIPRCPPAMSDPGLLTFRRHLWIARGPTKSRLHHDGYDNILCCLAGRRTLHVLPPSASRWLRPHGAAGSSATQCPRWAGAYAKQAGALAPGAMPPLATCTLFPGDAVYIPEGFWHEVHAAPLRSDGLAVAVSFWWLSGRTDVFSREGTAMEAHALRIAAQHLAARAQARILHRRELRLLRYGPRLVQLRHVFAGGCLGMRWAAAAAIARAPPRRISRAIRRAAARARRDGRSLDVLRSLDGAAAVVLGAKLDEDGSQALQKALRDSLPPPGGRRGYAAFCRRLVALGDAWRQRVCTREVLRILGSG